MKINEMISIISQMKEDMKKAKVQAVNFISHGLSFGQVNKREYKGKPNHEKKKARMKEQGNKP